MKSVNEQWMCFFIGLLWLVPGQLFSQVRTDTVWVGLEEAVQHALRVSPEVGQMDAQRDFAEARHGLARASRFLTEFDLETGHSVAPGLTPTSFPANSAYLDPNLRNDWDDLRPYNQAELSIGQPLFTWGELNGSIDAARHGISVADAEVRSKSREVALRTAELYYGLLLTEELHRLVEETGEILEQANEQISRLLNEGAEDVDDADLFQVQIVEQEYVRRVVEVEQNRTLARSALSRQLFLPEGTLLLAEDRLLTPLQFTLDSLSVYLGEALHRRPEMAQAEAGLAARSALVKVARSDYYPKLFLGATVRARYAAGRTSQSNPFVSDPFLGQSTRVGIGFRQNLNFFQTQSRVRQAEAERNEVRHLQTAARQLISFEVEDAYRKFIIAEAALNAQDKSLQISKEWLRTEQINFDLELGDTENLVRAVQANLELQAQYFEAVRKYNVAVLRLLDATGILVEMAQSGTLVETTEP